MYLVGSLHALREEVEWLEDGAAPGEVEAALERRQAAGARPLHTTREEREELQRRRREEDGRLLGRL